MKQRYSRFFAAFVRTGALLGAFGSVTIAGCENDPAKNVPKAEVGRPTEPSGPAARAALVYRFEAPESKLDFVGAKVTRKHQGSFGKFSGTIRSSNGKPENSSVIVDIDVSTISVDEERLTRHLKSPDFFDVQKFPTARFVSTSVKAGGQNGATHTITGNLELHGITKSISFPATIHMAGDTVHANAEFVINRQDFGIAYPGMPDDLIKDDVAIKLSVVAKKASAT